MAATTRAYRYTTEEPTGARNEYRTVTVYTLAEPLEAYEEITVELLRGATLGRRPQPPYFDPERGPLPCIVIEVESAGLDPYRVRRENLDLNEAIERGYARVVEAN